MMKSIDTTGTLYHKADSIRIAAEMNASGCDDWSYVAVHNPKGGDYSFINVFDEDGYFVAKM